MIKFETLDIKIETNNIYTIFLWKKNVRSNIIKIILEYPSIAVPTFLKEWKTAIILIRQGYKSIEDKQDYKTGSGITYEEKELPMDIGKAKDNHNKDRKPRCLNHIIYGHIAKDCRKPKKKEIRKCYKCYKVEHLTKNYRLE